jgi:hypothetical protein
MRFRIQLSAALLVLFASACSPNTNRFAILRNRITDGLRSLSRTEVAAQGGKELISVGGGHSLTRVTVGGSYLRRPDPSAGVGGHSAALGLHADPNATE